MSDKKVFLIRPSFFSRARLLVLGDDDITMGLSEDEPALIISIDEIDAYRFVAARSAYFLYSYYRIDIRSLSGGLIKIRMFSWFGFGAGRLRHMYEGIMDSLWHKYFKKTTENYFAFLINGIDFTIAELIFTSKGLAFSSTSPIILWEDVGISSYHFHCTVYSKEDNFNYRSFNYRDDWNAMLIYSLVNAIVDHVTTND